jgi:hypothetical protein
LRVSETLTSRHTSLLDGRLGSNRGFVYRVFGCESTLTLPIPELPTVLDQQSTISHDPTVQILSRESGLSRSPISRNSPASNQRSAILRDPTTVIKSRVHVSRVVTTLAFDFPDVRVSEMLIFHHVSFPAPMARINSTLSLANLPKSESSNSRICCHLSTLTMDGSDDFGTSGLGKVHSPVYFRRV